MKYVLFFLTLATFCSGCKPDTDLGDRTLDVRVMIVNELSGTGAPEPLKGVDVFVSDEGVTTSYLLSARTDSLGRVKFTNLLKEGYTIYARVQQSELVYYAEVNVANEQNFVELELRPEGTSQNGLFLLVLNDQGEPVQGAEVSWAMDPSQVAGNAVPPSVQISATDLSGRFSLVNRPPGDHYLRVRKASAFLEGRITMTVQEDGIERDTLRLLPGSANGCIITCTDPSGTGLQWLRVDLHTSLASAQANDTTLSPYGGFTNIQGKYQLASIEPREYFITIRSTVQGIAYSDVLTINSTGITTPTYVLTPVALTGCRLDCVDGFGNGVAGLLVNAYTSLALADTNNVDLRSYFTTTTVLGQAYMAPMEPRKYYIAIVNEAVGIDKLDSVLVTPGNVVQQTIQVLP